MLSVNTSETAVLIKSKRFPYTMPVKWHSPSAYPNLPDNLSDWLLNTGSLTERLQALTNDFNVDLLGQSEQALDASEQLLLRESANKNWQVREVILQGEAGGVAKDWVFARSVLPDLLCKSTWVNLGSQPLGQRIFNDDKFVRSEFEIGQLAYHPLSSAPFAENEVCWARRSRFQIGEHSLLVAEAFLPDSPFYR
jgi:chorismate--pyruvate lyase